MQVVILDIHGLSYAESMKRTGDTHLDAQKIAILDPSITLQILERSTDALDN